METEVWIALAVAIPGAILAIIVMAAGGSRRARDLWRKSKESDDVEGVPYWMGRPPSLEEGLVGRKNDLKEIKGAFKKKKEVILAGGAGSGKSRLAVEHTYRSKARGFWTPAGADVQQTLIALAPSFDIPTQGLSEADIAAAVRRRLADLPDKTLWAVDNLPSLDQFTALHEAAGPIRLLVTTRDSRKPLLSGTATLKKVGVLEPAAAVALLCSRDGCKRDEPVAAEIAQEVGYLPLALEILAIRLAREGQTARALLEELRSAPDQASVDAFQSAAGTTIDGAEGVLATLSGALDSLDGETRGRLAPFGYVADAPIPKPLAMALADADDGRFADFLEECASQSLVAASEGFMEIHGLTIAAIRATNVGGAAPRAALARGLPRLAAINESDPPALRAEMAHYDALLEQARAASPPDEGAIPTFANNLAIAYGTLGPFIEAIPLFEQTLLDVERLRGPEHPDTLGSRNNLADSYREAGRVAEATPLNEQTLETLERILGREHPDTLGSRNNLAAAYAEAGRTDDAIPLFEQTLAARERLLGPEHPETLKSRNNLANAYQEAGPGRRGGPAARADPGGPRAAPGARAPRYARQPQQPGQRVRDGGPRGGGDPAARADPGGYGADPGPRAPRYPQKPQQPRQRVPGRGPPRRSDRSARAHPAGQRAALGPRASRRAHESAQPGDRLPSGGARRGGRTPRERSRDLGARCAMWRRRRG